MRIDQLLQELDVPAPQSQNPIQFYQLKNTKAADVLATISGLLAEGGTETLQKPETMAIGKPNASTALASVISTAATPQQQPAASTVGGGALARPPTRLSRASRHRSRCRAA